MMHSRELEGEHIIEVTVVKAEVLTILQHKSTHSLTNSLVYLHITNPTRTETTRKEK